MARPHLPNLLSGSRLLLAPVSFLLIYQQHWVPAALVLLTAVLTDILDGHLARRLRVSSTLGGLLDHSSDAVFVSVTLAALASQQVITWLLPLLVISAFSQYLLDSNALRGQPLRASQLGRYNGIAYFVLAGWPVLQYALDLPLLADAWFGWIAWILVASTLASMFLRAQALLQLRG
ncbi:MAG: CDP-alcohol phosphatidyltransferase family protein [Pseudomonadales bacterium]|nr:CDP-alcohol phosphatidyltransferase family protein [Pseudomonadales bacterium]